MVSYDSFYLRRRFCYLFIFPTVQHGDQVILTCIHFSPTLCSVAIWVSRHSSQCCSAGSPCKSILNCIWDSVIYLGSKIIYGNYFLSPLLKKTFHLQIFVLYLDDTTWKLITLSLFITRQANWIYGPTESIIADWIHSDGSHKEAWASGLNFWDLPHPLNNHNSGQSG